MASPDQIAFVWREPEGANPLSHRRTNGGGADGGCESRAVRVAPVACAVRPALTGAMELPPDSELWRIQHAARFLKMSRGWVYKRVERGEIPCIRVNGWALRFVPTQLRAWAEGQGRRR